MTIDEDALSIYTDGSSLGKPRTGGIGVRFVTIEIGRASCRERV